MSNDVMDITDHMNCLEKTFLTVCDFYNVDFTNLFADAWGFSFSADKPKGKNVLYSDQDLSADALKFLGLEVDRLVQDPDVAKEVIKNVIRNGEIAVLENDAFFCPWSRGFEKMHVWHYFSIIDVTEEGFVCLDPFFSDEKKLLPFSAYEKAFDSVLTFNKVEIKEQLTLESAFIRIAANKGMDEMFQMMEDFSVFLSGIKEKDMLYDFTNDVYLCHNVRNLKFTADGRFKFGYLLEKLVRDESVPNTEAIEIYEKFYECGNEWQIVNNMVIKLFYMPKLDAVLLDKLSKRVFEIAQTEKGLYQKIKSAVLTE